MCVLGTYWEIPANHQEYFNVSFDNFFYVIFYLFKYIKIFD